MIKIKGGRKLQALMKKIESCPDAMAAASDGMAEEATNLIAEGWRDQADPYGKAWKARARETKRSRGKQILVDSGDMKATWHKESVSRRGFTVASGVKYSSYHQDGRGVAQRMVVPSKGKGLPSSWTDDLGNIIENTFEEFFA